MVGVLLLVEWYGGRTRLDLCSSTIWSRFKRSLSDGNILHESPSPTSTSNINKGFSNGHFSNDVNRGTIMLSESTPEISTSESELACPRDTPSIPTRELFTSMQRSKYIEHENGEAIDWSNFIDLDWLSSSANSCDEELLVRSMLSASSTAVLSSENVIDEIARETTSSTSECGSSTMGREHTVPDLRYGVARKSEVVEGLSDTFVHWVMNGETLCH